MITEITQLLTLDYLRRLVVDAPDTLMTQQVGKVINHPAWIIGHLVHSFQGIGGEMRLDPWLPPDWGTRFGTGSTPAPDREMYPSKAAIMSALDDAQKRILDRLQAVGEEGLKLPLPDERHRPMFPTVGHAVLHILRVHTAMHVGQITVWRRAVGLGPLSGIFV